MCGKLLCIAQLLLLGLLGVYLASETLIGVTQLKIGNVCLFIYVCGRTYVICTLTLAYFCVRSVFDPIPNSTESSGLAITTRITLEIELFTALNCFAGAVKT